MKGKQQSFLFGCALVVGLIAAFNGGVIQNELYLFAKQRIVGTSDPSLYPNANNPLALIGIGVVAFVISLGLLSMAYGLIERATNRWDRMAIGDKVNVFLGAFVAIVAALPFYVLIASANKDGNQAFNAAVTICLIVGLAAVAIYALKSMEEVLPWSQIRGRPKSTGLKILDTNVIIDGRIYDVARTGFLEGQIYVPKFVLEELQHIADSPDPLRRQRGRRGLDVLKLLQSEFPLEVGQHDKFAADPDEEVDARLVRLARAVGGELVTNDVNLNRVAALQSVKVLNLNDLAMALKPNVLPRESLTLMIAREGTQSGQGIGYLDDGTMVVVENGRRHIGATMRVVVTQVIQTERGKMIFADISDDDTSTYDDASGIRRTPRRRTES